MSKLIPLFVLISFLSPLFAQNEAGPPKSEKARKSFQEAKVCLGRHAYLQALDSFKAADKQDDQRCVECQQQIIKCATEVKEWKSAETAAAEMIDEAETPLKAASAHYVLGILDMDEGSNRHKEEPFERAHGELAKALAGDPDFLPAYLWDGVSLAHLKQDGAAKTQFEQYLKMAPPLDPNRRRASRFLQDPELARGRPAPPFSVTLLNGQRISLDDMLGKVVLIDFWATWCGACQDALPHIKEIANKFQGQPFVILSVSVDADQARWKSFVTTHGMTWLNYNDGGAPGPLATRFDVDEIPQTFIIDSDGMLQHASAGDASALDGRLKKLIDQAGPDQGKEAVATGSNH